MTSDFRRFEFTGQASGPHLLITGGIHGDEFEPIAAIRQLVRLFSSDSTEVSGLQGRVTLVPLVNEPAFLLGRRCAEDSLDLARTCPGRPDGTVTERIADSLSRLIREADFYIDLHTGGTEFTIWPLAGYMLHADAGVLEQQRRMARAFNLPVVWGTSANLDGRSLSVARDARVPAIYCEYLGGGTCRTEGVRAYVDGCLNVMAELGMLPHAPSPPPVQQVVEDARPQSGHLQIRHPSPVDGFFEAEVELGTCIDTGAILGTVSGMEDDRQTPILAETAGLVLMLRTFPRVRRGESVGVVLEIP